MSGQDVFTGRIFGGRYEIQDRIGIGGMAEVYRAQDKVLGRIVAVKVMLPQFAADPEFTRRFRQEAAAAANLQSPFIVNVYDWGQDDGTYYIVMEFVRGSDLKTAIQQRGAINQRKVAEIGSQVCQALTVAHNLDIIHRDIKPQNIMVQPDGNVKVMDFGIARAKNSVEQKTSAVLGTAHYISPEQAQGRDLTPASDIYSLGIVLYEAATGHLPFDGPDAVGVALQQVQDEPPLPSELNPNIDPALEDIILCALAKNPANRFATANDMRLALNDYLAGRPINLPGGTIPGASTRVMNPAGAPTAVMGGMNSTQVMPGVPGGTNPAVTGGGYRAPEQPKSKRGLIIGIVAAVVVVLAIIGAIVWGAFGQEGGKAVPDVMGLTLEQATQTLQQEGFEVGNIDRVNDPEAPEGTVIKQDPKADTQKPEGSKINLTLSQGAEMVTVPDLYNCTGDEARAALTAAGLRASSGDAEYSPDVEKGRVLRQVPEAGSKVAADTEVTYILSLGVEAVEIRSVVGLSETDARRTLENDGFKVVVGDRVYSSRVGEGEVVSQSPSAGGGAKANKGATITLTISKGPEPAPEPEPPSNTGNTGGDNQGGNTGGDNQGGNTGNTGGDNQGGNTGGDSAGGDNQGGNSGGTSGGATPQGQAE